MLVYWQYCIKNGKFTHVNYANVDFSSVNSNLKTFLFVIYRQLRMRRHLLLSIHKKVTMHTMNELTQKVNNDRNCRFESVRLFNPLKYAELEISNNNGRNELQELAGTFKNGMFS